MDLAAVSSAANVAEVDLTLHGLECRVLHREADRLHHDAGAQLDSAIVALDSLTVVERVHDGENQSATRLVHVIMKDFHL